MAAGSRPHPSTSTDKLLGIYKYAADNGFIISNLDDYLKLAEHLFEVFIDNNAVTLKNTLAYTDTYRIPGRKQQYPRKQQTD